MGSDMANRKFTDKFIKSIKLTTKGQVDYVDKTPPLASVHGYLGFKVGKQKKTWYIRYRFDNKRRSMKLGYYPALSLADARKAAIKELTDVSMGIDPQAKKEEYNNAPTMTDLWKEYQAMLDRRTKKKAPATLRDEQRKWEKELDPVIGKMKVVDVTPAILADLLDKKADTAPVSANRLHSLLSVLFKPALRKSWISIHPLQWIGKPSGAEAPRKRVLSDEELKTLWPYFNKLSDNPRDMLRLGLFTCQRPGEISKLRWEHIDLDQKIWTQHNTKNGSVHITPLSHHTMWILLKRWKGETKGYVFISKYNRGRANKEYSTGTKSARGRVQRDSGITGWHAHDIRRTGRTIMSRLQIDQHIRERILNHSQQGVVGIYDQYDYLKEKRAALDLLNDEILSILDSSAFGGISAVFRYSAVQEDSNGGGLACSPKQQQWINDHPEEYQLGVH